MIVRKYNTDGDCLCFREDCFLSFSDGHRKADATRRCSTCNQQNKQGKWYKVGEQDRDGVTLDNTGGEWRGTRTLVGLRRVLHEKVPRRGDTRRPSAASPTPMSWNRHGCRLERVQESVIVASGGIVGWREAGEWLRQALLWGKRFSRWLLSSADTDLWMIVLLGMSCGRIAPLGEGAVEVTARQVVGGDTIYLLVNRVYRSICQLQDGSESAWPEDGFRSWCPDDPAKVPGTPFRTRLPLGGLQLPPCSIQATLPEDVDSPGLFAKPICIQEDGIGTVDPSEGVELWATSYFFQHKATVADKCRNEMMSGGYK